MFRNSEIANFNDTKIINQNILQLDVSMDHIRRMDVLDAKHSLPEDVFCHVLV